VALVEVARVGHLLPLLVAARAEVDLPVAHDGVVFLTVCCLSDACVGKGDAECSEVLICG
jgi:hypothetical protein